MLAPTSSLFLLLFLFVCGSRDSHATRDPHSPRTVPSVCLLRIPHFPPLSFSSLMPSATMATSSPGNESPPHCFCGKPAIQVHTATDGLVYECHYTNLRLWLEQMRLQQHQQQQQPQQPQQPQQQQQECELENENNRERHPQEQQRWREKTDNPTAGQTRHISHSHSHSRRSSPSSHTRTATFTPMTITTTAATLSLSRSTPVSPPLPVLSSCKGPHSPFRSPDRDKDKTRDAAIKDVVDKLESIVRAKNDFLPATWGTNLSRGERSPPTIKNCGSVNGQQSSTFNDMSTNSSIGASTSSSRLYSSHYTMNHPFHPPKKPPINTWNSASGAHLNGTLSYSNQMGHNHNSHNHNHNYNDNHNPNDCNHLIPRSRHEKIVCGFHMHAFDWERFKSLVWNPERAKRDFITSAEEAKIRRDSILARKHHEIVLKYRGLPHQLMRLAEASRCRANIQTIGRWVNWGDKVLHGRTSPLGRQPVCFCGSRMAFYAKAEGRRTVILFGCRSRLEDAREGCSRILPADKWVRWQSLEPIHPLQPRVDGTPVAGETAAVDVEPDIESSTAVVKSACPIWERPDVGKTVASDVDSEANSEFNSNSDSNSPLEDEVRSNSRSVDDESAKGRQGVSSGSYVDGHTVQGLESGQASEDPVEPWDEHATHGFCTTRRLPTFPLPPGLQDIDVRIGSAKSKEQIQGGSEELVLQSLPHSWDEWSVGPSDGKDRFLKGNNRPDHISELFDNNHDNDEHHDSWRSNDYEDPWHEPMFPRQTQAPQGYTTKSSWGTSQSRQPVTLIPQEPQLLKQEAFDKRLEEWQKQQKPDGVQINGELQELELRLTRWQESYGRLDEYNVMLYEDGLDNPTLRCRVCKEGSLMSATRPCFHLGMCDGCIRTRSHCVVCGGKIGGGQRIYWG